MVAAKKGNVGIVRKLMKHGANMNLTDKVNQVLFQSKFERMTANSNKLRDCTSTKLMAYWSCGFPLTFAMLTLCEFPRVCSPLIACVISSFEHVINPTSPNVVLLLEVLVRLIGSLRTVLAAVYGTLCSCTYNSLSILATAVIQFKIKLPNHCPLHSDYTLFYQCRTICRLGTQHLTWPVLKVTPMCVKNY